MRMAATAADAIWPRKTRISGLIGYQPNTVGGNSRSGRYADGALAQAPVEHQRLRAVEDAFASLPERYLGADPGFSATTGSSSTTSD